MLQSDNGDRWPLWDQEFETSDESDEGKASEKKPTEHKVNDKKISTTKEKRSQAVKPSSQNAWNYISLGTELVAGVFVGTLLGWGVSRFFSRGAPLIIAIGVILGAAAGFLNLYRAFVEQVQKEEQKQSGSSD